MTISTTKLANKKQLAITRFRAGDLSNARTLCNEICKANPSDASVWCLLACINGRSNKYEEAVRCATKSVRINPSYDAAWVIQGNALLELKRPRDALKAYKRALKINSGNIEALCGQFSVLEMQHDLRGAEKVIKTALKKQPAHAQANLYAATLDHRNGKLEASSARLVRLLDGKPSEPVAMRAYNELGKVLEKLGQYDDAYKAYETSNRMQASEHKHTSADKRRIYEWIEHHSNALQIFNVSTWKASVNEDGLPDPVFLVGFPRSGTTLAEQLLSSHSKIEVSNEKPILKQVISSMTESIESQERYPYNLTQMNQSEIRYLRARYWELACEIPDVKPNGGLFVDKLPLNIIYIPLIYRLFPGARIIFALRDPRDVCISCYTNSFSVNDAMVNFTDIIDTVNLYAAIMDVWQTYQHVFPLNIYELRYEKLVSQFEYSAHDLIGFLGLEWDDNILKYYSDKNLRDVKTPSYQGIASPIYNSAVGRWKYFSGKLQPALTILEPYVCKYGYDKDAGI